MAEAENLFCLFKGGHNVVITAGDGIIDRIIRNKLDFEIDDGYILPHRFTQKQLGLYASLGKGFEANSLCTSGVCLDFITDSSFLKLKVKCSRADKGYASFDLYVDGYFVDSVTCDAADEKDSEVSFRLPEDDKGKHRVTVYLPHVVITYIKEIILEENSIVREAPGYQGNYLCLGGSISQGMTSVRPSSMYAVQLSCFLNMNLINQGVGGYYFDAESLDDSLNYNPDLITVAYGGNEGRICRSQDEFRDRCFNFMERLTSLYPHARIFVIPPTWRRSYNNTMSIGTHHDVARMINEVCERYSNVHVYDGLKLVPHMESFYTDGLHPTDEGFLYFTINLLRDMLGGSCK